MQLTYPIIMIHLLGAPHACGICLQALRPGSAAQDPPSGQIGWRWTDTMAAGDFNRTHFRESSQWKSLTRKHAQIISNDTFVLERFLVQCPADMQ